MSSGYVRTAIVDEQPAPNSNSGLLVWLKRNLFASPSDTLLTLLGIAFLLWAVPPLYNFLIGNAVFNAASGEACRFEAVGACWAYIGARLNFFIYGFFPIEEYWRPNLVFLLGGLL